MGLVHIRIVAGTNPAEMLKALDVPPDFDYSDKSTFLLDYIHYKKADLDFYFIRNTSDQWISRECGFRQQSKVPEIWDPVTGNILPVTVYNQQGKYIKIPVILTPYGSYFMVFKKGNPSALYTNVTAKGPNPPLMEFTQDGMLFLEEGTFKLEGRKESKLVKSTPKIQNIDGPWKVSFTKDWGAPDSAVFSELTSWNSSKIKGIKYYSGIGTYQKNFQFVKNTESSKNERIYLDLGTVSKVAEVWLNGSSLGISWAKPHKFDITRFIQQGTNSMTVEVANTWSNRLTGDALTGEKYTSTNILSTIIPGTNIWGSDQTRVPWAKVPLIESGLLGPVTIHTLQLVR